MNNEVSMITVTYNSAADLEKHWSRPLDLGVEWIVVDNASSDNSADVAERLGARVVRLPRNVGFSAANNVGAALAESACFIFVNPDVEVDSAGAKKLAKFAVEADVLAAPQLMNTDGTPQENGRTLPFLYRKLQHFIGGRGSRKSYEVVAEPNEVVNVSWVIGAALVVPSSVFGKIGGWDSKFFIYYEDSDICLRAFQAGYPTKLYGSVRWVHAWARATRRSVSLASWKLEIRSATRFYCRYPKLLLHPLVLRRVAETPRPTA